MRSTGVLILIPHSSNVGFAITTLEHLFFDAAMDLTDGNRERVHFAYQDISSGRPGNFPGTFPTVFESNLISATKDDAKRLARAARGLNVDTVIGLDLPVRRPYYRPLRESGVRTIISYYGAAMSSLNGGFKLIFKRLDAKLARSRPDHFVFESKAMQATAVKGRGLPESVTSVVPLGVDTKRFKPNEVSKDYAANQFRIPSHRRIVYYSGHLHKRKGVATLFRAAVELVDHRGREDIHFLLVGNKSNEGAQFSAIYENCDAANHITLGGYRHDIPQILAGCHVGVIPSDGWDSFTQSALEIQASAIPLIVSRHQGLPETIAEGQTGYTFEPGNHKELADFIEKLFDDEDHRSNLGVAARKRIEQEYTLKVQREKFKAVLRSAVS